jgi:hypothetical protein
MPKENIYNALPSKERAFFLRKNTDQKLNISLQEIFSFLNQLNDNSIKDRIQKIVLNEHTNSSKYILNSCLIDLIQDEKYNEIPEFLDSYQALSLLIKQDINVINYDLLQKPFKVKINSLCNIGTIKKPIFFANNQHDIDRNKINISKAFSIIKQIDIEYYEEILAFLDTIILVGANNINAGSSVDMLSMIFLEVKYINNPIDMIEIIIHEIAHMYLHFLNVDDALILNDSKELFESPFRKEKRPMMGVFHATFVAARIAHFFHKVKYSNVLTNQGIFIDEKISINRQRFEKSILIVEKHAKTTNMARQIIHTMPLLLKL